jgi:hypothetical protein
MSAQARMATAPILARLVNNGLVSGLGIDVVEQCLVLAYIEGQLAQLQEMMRQRHDNVTPIRKEL